MGKTRQKNNNTSKSARMARLRNRARFLEEASYGIHDLMDREGRSQAWLARRLGVSRSFVHKVIEGSHNFTLETLADVYFGLGRSVHLVLGDDLEELRLPVDEGKTSRTTSSLKIEDYEHLRTYGSTVFENATKTTISQSEVGVGTTVVMRAI